MNPQNVNPSNFKVEYILFDNEEFSIAYGKWESKNNRALSKFEWVKKVLICVILYQD